MQKLIFSIILLSVTCFVRGQELQYGNCPGCWNPDSLGNHRIVVRCNVVGNVARVVIPWRRRDVNPENKRIIVQDSTTGKIVLNKTTGAIGRESGEVFFQPVSGKGLYYIYYMPYRNEGRSNYPRGVYWKPDTTATAGWMKQVKAGGGKAGGCKALVEQSIDAFNSFYPMEIIATKKETEAIVRANKGKAFWVVPEDREHSIRMRNDLPYRWVKTGTGLGTARISLVMAANKGGYFAFQLGIYAFKDLRDVHVNFSDLTGEGGRKIPAASINCINTGGIRYDGTPFVKRVDVPARQVQAMWCGVEVPADAATGDYSGTATVGSEGQKEVIRLVLKVGKDAARDEPQKMTRLNWLNSTLAQTNDVIAPYTPLVVQGDTLIDLLGRQVLLSKQGFPE